MVKVGQGYWLP